MIQQSQERLNHLLPESLEDAAAAFAVAAPAILIVPVSGSTLTSVPSASSASQQSLNDCTSEESNSAVNYQKDATNRLSQRAPSLNFLFDYGEQLLRVTSIISKSLISSRRPLTIGGGDTPNRLVIRTMAVLI